MIVKLWALPHQDDLQEFQVQEDTFANFERYNGEELVRDREDFHENALFNITRYTDPIEICGFEADDIIRNRED